MALRLDASFSSRHGTSNCSTDFGALFPVGNFSPLNRKRGLLVGVTGSSVLIGSFAKSRFISSMNAFLARASKLVVRLVGDSFTWTSVSAASFSCVRIEGDDGSSPVETLCDLSFLREFVSEF
jgi:hypothetical protein